LESQKEAKIMAVSEDDVKEQEIIQDDFRKAEEIFNGIVKKMGTPSLDSRAILFTLCLIYVRQLKHHKYEEIEER